MKQFIIRTPEHFVPYGTARILLGLGCGEWAGMCRRYGACTLDGTAPNLLCMDESGDDRSWSGLTSRPRRNNVGPRHSVESRSGKTTTPGCSPSVLRTDCRKSCSQNAVQACTVIGNRDQNKNNSAYGRRNASALGTNSPTREPRRLLTQRLYSPFGALR